MKIKKFWVAALMISTMSIMGVSTVYAQEVVKQTSVQKAAAKPVEVIEGDSETYVVVLNSDGTVKIKFKDGRTQMINGLTEVEKIYYNAEILYAVKGDGTVFAAVLNHPYDSELDVSDSRKIEVKDLQQIVNLNDIVCVAGSYVLKNDGTVWKLAFNYEEPGNKDSALTISVVKQVSGLKNIKYISAGHQLTHAVAIDNEGNVWTWGVNYFGQLGNGKATHNLKEYGPVKVPGITKAKKACTLTGACVVLTEDGSIWEWGDSAKGAVIPNKKGLVLQPVKIQNVKGITDIATCQSSVIALNKQGQVYIWGCFRDTKVPTLQKNLPKIKAISGGGVDYSATTGYSYGVIANYGSVCLIDEQGKIWISEVGIVGSAQRYSKFKVLG